MRTLLGRIGRLVRDLRVLKNYFKVWERANLVLRQMSRTIVDNPRKQIEAIRKQIHILSQWVVTEDSRAELANLRAELEHLYMDEELYWRQRCKNQWAKEGDRNTRFFHAKASKRYKSNLIFGLFDAAGQWKEEIADVERIVLDYFGDLFQTSALSSELIDEILGTVTAVVTPAMN